MNLEALPKFYSPKSPKLSDDAPATSNDALSVTDVMAAQGMTQNRASFGFSAFLGKLGISITEKEKAIALLSDYALARCDRVPALRKLSAEIKHKVIRILAVYAFEDYSRSASTTRTCDCCNGEGFIDAEVFSIKTHTPGKNKEFVKMSLHMGVKDIKPSAYEVRRQVREINRVLCHQCKGKKVVSSSCNDCHGRGKAVNRELTAKQGVPVFTDCKRCGGNGYARMPSTEALEAIRLVTDAISLDTWKKSVKKFYDDLIEKFEVEEAWAEEQLRRVTK
ncbi:antitermination protein Q [Escherichia coli]